MPTQLKKYVCTTATGTGDGSSLANAYTSLEACMNANEQNLVTADQYFDVEIGGDCSTADTTAVTIHNYTTDATRYINIYTTATARHQGIFSTSYYLLSTTTIPFNMINGATTYITLDGIQVLLTTSNGNQQHGIFTHTTSKVVSVVKNCIVKGALSGTATLSRGIVFNSSGAGSVDYCYNNIVYNWTGGNNDHVGMRRSAAGVTYFYNNTVYNCNSGITLTTGTSQAINNIVVSCTTNIAGTYLAGSGYNLCDDASLGYTVTGGATGDVLSASADFVSTTGGSEDFHLQSTSDAINVGSDLSATFTTDIDGTTRPTGANTWDIGADEYVASGSTIHRRTLVGVGI